MLKHRLLTFERITRQLKAFEKVLWTKKLPLAVTISSRCERISYAEAMKLKYGPVRKGRELGPRFSTFWFKVSGEVPKAWRKGCVDLIFNTQSEGTVWLDGKPVQGINPTGGGPLSDRFDFRLPAEVLRSGKVDLAIETACNRLFGAHQDEIFRFEEASLALFDPEAWEMYHNLYVPWSVLKLRTDKNALTAHEGLLLSTLNEICNQVDPSDRSTWSRSRPLFQKIYAAQNGSRAVELSAIGHAHIDTAWLWPLAETKRKCIRSFSTALKYMREYPEYKFSCSQAFQYQWMKDEAPSIYQGIKEAIKRGQWIPVGGTWIEPDCNIPSGESLVRQFLYGKRFFREEFGWDCKEFWNPDVFGYTGQLPQIMKQSGIDYFLTQKLSWNQFNKPQHQNFIWKGIDGTGVLTHFPPSDTYNSMCYDQAVAELRKSETNHQDLERTPEAMILYGWGDGGGGPSRHMLEVLRRAQDFQGLPRTEQRDPGKFFRRLEQSLTDAPVMEGELYFEYHRGTYTTQAANKRDNRASELALRRLEVLAVFGALDGRDQPVKEIERLWKLVLLNQFHDILPGSSIKEVYEDSAKDYADVLGSCAKLERESLNALKKGGHKGTSLFNALGWNRAGLVELKEPGEGSQKSHSGTHLVLASVPSLGFSTLCPLSPAGEVSISESPQALVLENNQIRASFNQEGCLTSLIHLGTGRETIEAGKKGNRFVLFDDRPVTYDAWDVDAYHLETRRELPGANRVRVLEKGPLRTGLEFRFQFGSSTLRQKIFLAADSGFLEFDTEVDWQHREKFLKVEFPLGIRAREAAYEMPFGLARRPTTFNNSYEMAQFEVCGHRWADVSEPDFGAALFTDSKYGYACHGQVLRLSLLRGPAHPDPLADQGQHRFRYAFYPHAGDLVQGEVVRRAHEFNQGLVHAESILPETSLLQIDSPHLVIDTVKIAEDSGDMIVRLYECHGARGSARLTAGFAVASAQRVNLLEESVGKMPWKKDGVDFVFRPFEILTFKLKVK